MFDQDGTLWVEHPMYSQVVYCLDRVPAVVAKKPKLRNVEPFKTVLSGNREAIAKLSLHDLEKILIATLTGMSVEEFRPKRGNGSQPPNTRVGTGPTPSWPISRCSKCCSYLRDNGYKTYIVTGGGQDFVRIYAEKYMASRPSRWSAPRVEQNTDTARTASRS